MAIAQYAQREAETALDRTEWITSSVRGLRARTAQAHLFGDAPRQQDQHARPLRNVQFASKVSGEDEESQGMRRQTARVASCASCATVVRAVTDLTTLGVGQMLASLVGGAQLWIGRVGHELAGYRTLMSIAIHLH
jgi:hypothetical protein